MTGAGAGVYEAPGKAGSPAEFPADVVSLRGQGFAGKGLRVGIGGRGGAPWAHLRQAVPDSRRRGGGDQTQRALSALANTLVLAYR